MTARKSVLETNLERLFARAYVPIEPSPEFRARLLRAIRTREVRARRPWFPVPLRLAAAAAIALAAGIVLWRSSTVVPSGPENLAGEQTPEPAVPPVPPNDGQSLPDGVADPGAGSGSAVADRGLDAASPSDSGRTGAGAPGDSETVAPPDPAPELSVLRGSVTVAPDAEPPASFVVTLLRTERLPAVSRPQPHEFTGASFALEHLQPGSYTVFVRAPGFPTWQRGGVELRPGAEGVDLAVVLDRGATVRGRVIDTEGRPVDGATVLSETDTPSQLLPFATEGGEPIPYVAATSSGDGSFELGPLSRGRQKLRATRAGFGAAWSAPLDLTSDPSAEIVLRLVRPSAIEGRVARDDGSPWPGAIVIASWLDASANYLDRQCLNFGAAVADGMGDYAIQDLPPGLFVVLNVMEGREPGSNRVPRVQQVRLEEGARVRVDLPGGDRGTSVEGTLVARDGKPLAGRDITFLLAKEADTSWKATRSRDDGRFDFPSLVPGTYLVFAGGNLGTELAFQGEVEVPAVPVFRPVVRAGSGVLRGRVTEAETGRGLPSSVLVLEMESGNGPVFAGRIVSDAEGRYALSLLSAGKYRVTAHSTVGRLGQESADPVQVGEDGEPATCDLALRPGASLSVRVRDEDGRPIPGATLRFVDAGGHVVGFSPDEHPDSKGEFDVRGAKPGRWTLRVQHAGFEPSETVLDLAVGEDRSVDIRLHPVR